MKIAISSFVILLAITACSTQPPVVTAPWECISATEPRNVVIKRTEGKYYVFDCLWNGGDTSEGEGSE